MIANEEENHLLRIGICTNTRRNAKQIQQRVVRLLVGIPRVATETEHVVGVVAEHADRRNDTRDRARIAIDRLDRILLEDRCAVPVRVCLIVGL